MTSAALQMGSPVMAPRRQKRALLLTDMFLTRNPAFKGASEPWATRAIFGIRAIAQRINDMATEWLTPLGLTASKYNYLAVIYGGEGHSRTLGELGLHIHTTSASVTGVIDSLVKGGFVERLPHPEDRRSIVVRTTPKGERVMLKAYPLHHANMNRLMKNLTIAERRTLVELLLKLADGIEGAAEQNAEE
jgi:DNA-binding MarR family transcriptional regulator